MHVEEVRNIKEYAILDRIFRTHHISSWGVTSARPSHTSASLSAWIEKGMHGEMQWMSREDAIRKRKKVTEIAPWVRSVISCAIQYTPPKIPDELLSDPSRGIIARYALFNDYHDVLKAVLTTCAQEIAHTYPDMQYRVYVDTGPILEREFANAAGLGFVGRNSNLIDWSLGSYLFLCEIITSLDLPEMRNRTLGSCGNCHSCMQTCPTGAIIAEKTIDARKCISYLTIEYKGSIPEHLRSMMKNRIYGCDICQEVCPWNRKPVSHDEWMRILHLHQDRVAPPLESLLFFSDEAFTEHFIGSPIIRAKREGFMRNVAIALGNWGSHDARLLLQEIIRKDSSVLIKEHAEWGLRQI